jgi:DNA-binding transcriptional ArsR family regulator
MSLEAVYDDTDAPVVVIDGWTRKQAVAMLDWPTLRCDIFDELSNAQPALSLAANTRRLPMRDYEEVTALRAIRQEADLSLEELAERTGYAPSTLSNYLSALDQEPEIVAAWKDDSVPVERGHVLALKRVDGQLESLAETDGIPLDHGKVPRLAEKYKQIYLRNTIENERSVSYLREMIDEDLRRRVLQELDDRDHQEVTADGATTRAAQQVDSDVTPDPMGQPTPDPRQGPDAGQLDEQAIQQAMCLIHGGEADRQVAVTVCDECAGILQSAMDQRMPLIQALDQADDNDVS